MAKFKRHDSRNKKQNKHKNMHRQGKSAKIQRMRSGFRDESEFTDLKQVYKY